MSTPATTTMPVNIGMDSAESDPIDVRKFYSAAVFVPARSAYAELTFWSADAEGGPYERVAVPGFAVRQGCAFSLPAPALRGALLKICGDAPGVIHVTL